MRAPLASLSLDLDNKWSYLRTYGSTSWAKCPTYLPQVVPTILAFLERHELKITFFLVGRDVDSPENRDCVRSIADAGHDIANHSFNHEPWLHLFSEAALDEEIERAEDVIQRVTGRATRGFRGPGYSISKTHLEVLSRRGYRFDASSFPNALNPLSRAYLFARSSLTREQREQRKGLFGTFSDALRPVDPFDWELSGSKLLEIPVTTMPFFRLPFHFSYVLYLAGFSELTATVYFRAALRLCRLAGTSPSLLLHPLDFMGREDDAEVAFFPGMDRPRDQRLRVLDRAIRDLKRRFRVVDMAEQCDVIESSDRPRRSCKPSPES